MIYLSEYDCVDKQQDRRREHELGRQLLTFGLKEKYGRDYSVVKDSAGKPVLEDEPGIFFNISHTRGVVVCAISDQAVGIDVEYIRPFDERLMRRICTEEEQAYIYQLRDSTGDDRSCHRRFFRLWTLKESFLKATGHGISLPLREISFSVDEEESGRNCVRSNRPGWKFWQFLYGGGYIVSVCQCSRHNRKCE